MITVGLVVNPSLASYKRRFIPLLESNNKDVHYENAIKDKCYDCVITDQLYIGNEYKYNILIFEIPDDLFKKPYEWYKLFPKYYYKIKDFLFTFPKMRKHLNFFDYIITGSEMQAESYVKYTANISCSYIVDPIGSELIIPSSGKKLNAKELNLGIECSGLNVHSIINNYSFIEAMNTIKNIKLHIIIDKYNNNIYKVSDSHQKLLEIFGNKVSVYKWTEENYKKIMNVIDIAVVPVDMKCEFAINKPENRPLLMLANKKPTICSPIRSYNDKLSSYNLIFFANTKEEWINSIQSIKNMQYDDLIRNIDDDHKKVTNNSLELFVTFHNDIIRKLLE